MESESESGAAADTPPLETLSFHGDEEIIEVVELDPGPPDPGEKELRWAGTPEPLSPAPLCTPAPPHSTPPCIATELLRAFPLVALSSPARPGFWGGFP